MRKTKEKEVYRSLADIMQETCNNTEKWLYYGDVLDTSFNNLKINDLLNGPNSEQNAQNFIQKYFGYGAKECLFSDVDCYGHKKMRFRHSVSEFFIGIYIMDNLLHIRERKKFLWKWFLCSLYHDIGYEYENQKIEQINSNLILEYDYLDKTGTFVYPKSVIVNYQLYRKYGMEKLDHGIYGAEILYQRYTYHYDTLKALSDSEKTLLSNDGSKFNYKGRYYGDDLVNEVAYIAKIIASHNVFRCQEGKEAIYHEFGLDKLLGKVSKKTFRSVNEKLFFLLAICDTIEPIKRGLALYDVSIDIFNNSIRILINEDVKCKDLGSYREAIAKLSDWVRYVSVSPNSLDSNEYVITTSTT